MPDWGFEQQEVTCARGGTLPNSVWYVESNIHTQLQDSAEKVNYRNPGFFGKFWELQRVMWTTNAGLVESHAWDSRPPSWPILRRGINFWGKDNRQIYLHGNPLVWWASTAAVGLYVAFKALAVLRWQRNCNDYSTSDVFKRFDYEIGTSVLGWAFHYFPFFLMQRQLFLHHYFPALFFAIVALCQVHDFVTNRVSNFGGLVPGIKNKPALGMIAGTVFLAASIVVFSLYAPIAYGNVWTKKECQRVKLLDTWDWDCNTFLDSVSLPLHTTGEFEKALTRSAVRSVLAQRPPGLRSRSRNIPSCPRPRSTCGRRSQSRSQHHAEEPSRPHPGWHDGGENRVPRRAR